MKKLLTLFSVLLLLTVITACDNDNDNQEIQVLTENNFADDGSLRANFENNNLVKFLEHPGNQTTAKDTGDTGSDIIPVSYSETTEHTFCWDDSDPESEHTMTLLDSEGFEILSLQANDECVTGIIEAGDYEVRLDHDGRVERSFPIFMINEEKGFVAGKKSLNNSKNIFYSTLEKINIVRPANAQTVQQNINTLLTTNECISCNLVGALLTGADLMLSNISGSDLTGATLTAADLSGSTMIGVILNNANLIQANLNGTSIIEGATLIGANLTGAAINDATLTQANFTAAVLTDSSFIASIFGNTNFTDAIMIGSNLLDTNLNDAILTGADFTNATYCNNCVCQDSTCDNCGPVSECSIGLGDTELKKLTILINSNDIQMLQDSGFNLNISVKVNGIFNVVWFSDPDFQDENDYSWSQDFELFGTNTFEDDALAEADTNLLNISPGQSATLNSMGVFEVEADPGIEESITATNNFEPIYLGLAQQLAVPSGMQDSLPVFVSPELNNLETGLLTPSSEVMLWFGDTETGRIFINEPQNNIILDFTDIDEITVNYSGGNWTLTEN